MNEEPPASASESPRHPRMAGRESLSPIFSESSPRPESRPAGDSRPDRDASGEDGQLELFATQDRPGWRGELRDAIRSGALLLERLGLEAKQLSVLESTEFPVLVPEAYFSRIRHGDPRDPLLRQVLPIADELTDDVRFVNDPVQDLAARQAPGVLHKYEGRALLVVTGACAVHCRYCFRRHFPYGAERVSQRAWQQTLDYLRGDDSIEEVLLSGGDPLTLGDESLCELLDDLESLSHLQRIRIHTRLPIVIPNRVNPELLDRLARGPTRKVVVVHANHANEIDSAVERALLDLAREVVLLNQSVLLSGVNDSVDALAELCERLVASRALPYYLHLLDPVRGASHFDVSGEQGRALIEQLRGRLPGYAVPRLVREVPRAVGKTIIA